jgi:RNA polymerase sigma factor (sigma-70 family)
MSNPAITRSAEPDRAFLESLPLIDRIVAAIARRHALDAVDGEDFSSWVKTKIVESDYALFRKFSGRCSLSTYLTTVISNLFRDYRNSQWGRWRPSAEALRRGPVAVRLECLLYRDGLPLRDAVQVLRSSCPDLPESQLVRMAAQLPRRATHSEVSLDQIVGLSAELVAVPPALTESERQRLATVEEVLRVLVGSLAPEDAVILRMRFWDDISVADIARSLRLEQKPLYRRLERIQSRLKLELEARGVDRASAAELLSGDFGQ